ncbi:DUF6879 family protein [Streptomyces lavendulocolor]|uniref:DUF6879 family protein n=1 Tax=Streptomyces lavendulocolor TaxID=67316 RepID=UPI00340EE997
MTSFKDLIVTTQQSIVNLEMRDMYQVADETEDFEEWKRTGLRDAHPYSPYWARWVDLVSSVRRRGVVLRRARIVAEPVTDYIRYEHAGTFVRLFAGEQVRWLPRHKAVDLLLPGCDLWLFDKKYVLFSHFTGDGQRADPPFELSTDPYILAQCSSAFDKVWERAVPHDQYELR